MNTEDIIDLEIVDVRTLERHTLKYNTTRHKLVETDGPEDGSKLVTFEPISGPED